MDIVCLLLRSRAIVEHPQQVIHPNKAVEKKNTENSPYVKDGFRGREGHRPNTKPIERAARSKIISTAGLDTIFGNQFA